MIHQMRQPSEGKGRSPENKLSKMVFYNPKPIYPNRSPQSYGALAQPHQLWLVIKPKKKGDHDQDNGKEKKAR